MCFCTVNNILNRGKNKTRKGKKILTSSENSQQHFLEGNTFYDNLLLIFGLPVLLAFELFIIQIVHTNKNVADGKPVE
jgi:hypothetical protein